MLLDIQGDMNALKKENERLEKYNKDIKEEMDEVIKIMMDKISDFLFTLGMGDRMQYEEEIKALYNDLDLGVVMDINTYFGAD